jgi:Flp pilus assembly protein TadD
MKIATEVQEFLQAVQRKEQGDLVGAYDLIVDLTKRCPNDWRLYWYLGHLSWRLERLDEAVQHFQKASALAPDSERASLGLFPCLWESGQRSGAVEEAKRFLAIKDKGEK